MAIVSISRGSNSRGAEVAEKAARLLGYRCLAREAVVKTAGVDNIPTAASRAKLRDLALAASVRAALMGARLDFAFVDVNARDGVVQISFEDPSFSQGNPRADSRQQYLERLTKRVHECTSAIPGLQKIQLNHRDE